MRFKHINCPYCFLELNYRSFNLKQRLIDEDIESNPGPTQNDFKSPGGRPRKIKVFKGTKKKIVVLVETLMLMFLVISGHNIFFKYNSTSELRHY